MNAGELFLLAVALWLGFSLVILWACCVVSGRASRRGR